MGGPLINDVVFLGKTFHSQSACLLIQVYKTTKFKIKSLCLSVEVFSTAALIGDNENMQTNILNWTETC